MLCLASINSKLEVESAYVRFLLSIDGCRHPLLVGYEADDDQSDWSVSYANVRRFVLKVVFRNLATLLDRETTASITGSGENERYVGFCIKMFQAMEARCTELQNLSEERRDYVDWCRDVFQMVQEYQVVRSHSRLVFWMDWERSLN